MLLSALRRRAAGVVNRRAFHTARVSLANGAADGFQWQHLVTPYSTPEFSTQMRGIEQQLQAMKGELSGVPDKVEDIDWDEWEEKIDDKAMVHQIKQSYDNLKYDAAKEDSAEINADLDAAISSSGQSEAAITELVSSYKAELKAAEKEKAEIHEWHFHDYLRRYPGLAEQMRAEYMEGWQLPPESLERLTDSDVSELKRQVRNGGRLSSDEDIPTRVGDYDFEAELKKTEEFARKMLGDSPQLKDIQAQIQKEQLAVQQMHEADAHVEEGQH